MAIKLDNFSQHFLELRNKLLLLLILLILFFIVSYIYANDIFDMLTYPLYSAFESQGTLSRRLIYTGLSEKFLTNVKLSLFSSFLILFPFIFIQLWLFIAPALYKQEKIIFILLIVLTPLLFILGMLFVYFLIFPMAWNFFIGFEQLGSVSSLAVELEAKVSEYLSLSMSLLLAFGISFELPILLILLVKLGIIDYNFLRSKRKYGVLISFIVAAILTPPDPLSQIGLAIPLMLLYELSVFVSRFIKNKSVKD